MPLVNTRDRFKQAPWYNPDQKVTIGGLGSIGSWLTLFMGRLVNTVYVYDLDKVEEENIAGSLYGSSHIDMDKEFATKKINTIFNPQSRIVSRGKFKQGSGVTPICFAGFDNMEARKNIFNSWKSLDNREILIDGHLAAEELWVYAVTPDNQDKYEEHYLPDDDEVEDLPCSFKCTTHISAMIASYMTTCFTNYLSNKEIEDIRVLPFEITYQASLNRLTNTL